MCDFFIGIAVAVLGILVMTQGFDTCLECATWLP
jgi:hypothetical protein